MINIYSIQLNSTNCTYHTLIVILAKFYSQSIKNLLREIEELRNLSNLSQ